jgi:hypothetical protein
MGGGDSDGNNQRMKMGTMIARVPSSKQANAIVP